MKEPSGGLQSLRKTFRCPTDAPEFSTQIPVIEKSWDYRDLNIKSPVRDQGFQGLGQVHASISAIEQHYQNKYSLATKRFSVQQALDCLHPDSIDSLTTGDVYRYYARAGGIATETSYPFQP